jgi:hypothetical protein
VPNSEVWEKLNKALEDEKEMRKPWPMQEDVIALKIKHQRVLQRKWHLATTSL